MRHTLAEEAAMRQEREAAAREAMRRFRQSVAEERATAAADPTRRRMETSRLRRRIEVVDREVARLTIKRERWLAELNRLPN
ncbi:MAG: hypothetical protein CL424_07745 [Acidimicrobiaceae bacterium]|nr:hypothetical protein [Acidimicrobiaceae bacterium]